jgi:hypothetical protein
MKVSKTHKNNNLPAALLLVNLFFSYLWRWVGHLLVPSLPTVPEHPPYIVVCVGLLMISICYTIWLGKRWAVWLFAFVFALEVIMPALDYKHLLAGFQQQPLTLLPFGVAYLLEGPALWLLFSKARP